MLKNADEFFVHVSQMLLSQVSQLYKTEQTVETPEMLASYPKIVHADFTAVQADNLCKL